MPWLAVPFSDSETCDNLEELFNVKETPHLVILDENGKVLTDDGVEIIRDYEAVAYPFTPERIRELAVMEERARKEQSLRSILAHNSLDFVLSAAGEKVPVTELEGNTVGLYFSLSSHRSCLSFTPILIDVYKKLKAKGDNFKIVLVPLDDDDVESSKPRFDSLPWYSLPPKDKRCVKMARYFDLSAIPTLVIIGPDGKTLQPNATAALKDHGVQAYPFSNERFAELAHIEQAAQQAQTLESLLVSGEQDFVINKSGAKVPISQLVGKNILLYFSAHWCPPCRTFLPKLIEAYHQIKAKDDAFEIIFISSDKDHNSFEEFLDVMPWLALPFGDERESYLSRKFKVFGNPKLVAIGPSGKTVSTEARDFIIVHGPKAYPFTSERVNEIESELEDVARGWPEKVKHVLHMEHDLVLTRRRAYKCDGCEEDGHIWSFYCEECDFDLHPKCALGGENGSKNYDWKSDITSNATWICDGHVCARK
ncbi:putative nucleoredoxin 1 isoform X2 [Silene latifolia]